MRGHKQSIALIELLLIAPAALFMGSLFLRQVQPALQSGRVVDWFSHHFVLGLAVFLVLMPVTALIVGCTVVARSWHRDSEFRRAAAQILSCAKAQSACFVIVGATLTAGGMLVIVGLHLITE
jgi:hypothetical protein